LEWADSDDVYLTGPADEVFSGEWPLIESVPPSIASETGEKMTD
jgi:hypothetical protein